MVSIRPHYMRLGEYSTAEEAKEALDAITEGLALVWSSSCNPDEWPTCRGLTAPQTHEKGVKQVKT